MDKQLGKIARVAFGRGGYQDAMLGLTVVLTGEGWGTTDFWGTWNRPDALAADNTTLEKIRVLLLAAKADTVADLQGKPVEVTFSAGRLESWRVLSEVL